MNQLDAFLIKRQFPADVAPFSKLLKKGFPGDSE
jgi:hypothetical protein